MSHPPRGVAPQHARGGITMGRPAVELVNVIIPITLDQAAQRLQPTVVARYGFSADHHQHVSRP